MNTQKTPLLIGLRAARANFIPGLIVQALMVALVAAYYLAPAAHAGFAALAEAKRTGGFLFTAIASAFAGGVLPELFVVVIFQRGKFRRENFASLLFSMAYWAFDGLLVDVFYRFQTFLFGSQVDAPTVIKKVLVDQFLFTPFLTTTISMTCYEWKNQGYSFAGLSRTFTVAYYKNKSFPAVIAAWGVWIPLVTVIYSLPPLLQVPLFILALTFWVMIFTYITVSEKNKTGLSFSAEVGDASPSGCD